MILWLNGTFGVGKTTTANAIHDQAEQWRLFDPEHVGYLLSANLRDLEFSDFQDLAPWRTLVPTVMAEIGRFTGDNLLAVQTVLREDYWKELRAGFDELGLPIFHVLLDCDEAEIRKRIEADEVERQARDWRIEHLVAFEKAKPWMTTSADLTIDSSALSPEATAAAILAAVSNNG